MPNDVNVNLKFLGVSTYSTVPRSNNRHYADFEAFLAHFSSLEVLRLTTYDLNIDIMPAANTTTQEDGNRSYQTLLDRLAPIAAHLTTLDLGFTRKSRIQAHAAVTIISEHSQLSASGI